MFGWNMLAFVLKKEGVYVQGCSRSYPNLITTENNTLNNSLLVQTNRAESAASHINALFARGPYQKLSCNTTASPGVEEETFYVDCPSQDEHLSLAFTIAIGMMGLFAFPVGWSFDRWGLRITRLVAM